MKISLNWLNDYIATGLDAEKIADILSDHGFACEGIERFGDDSVIDIEVTSNRGDCLGYIGVARELAVATGKTLKIPVVKLDESDKNVSRLAAVEIAEPDLCSRYTARVIEGIRVGPSPDWVVKRLESAGMRTVNNVVDATNYAMLETGQPPHAFDYEKIAKGKIIVRKAVPGERLTSIDGSKCDLDPDMLIIADAEKPVAIAGVMGGLETEVSDETTAVLLEDAWFDPVSVRTTSRKLSLPSEASFRFERIVDEQNIDFASQRTAQLIVQLAGGKVAKGVVDCYPKKAAQKQVALRLSRLNKLLGIEVPPDKTVAILEGLKFNPKRDGDNIICKVPSWRHDVYREADLIEEVARIYGYRHIPIERKIHIEVVPVDARQRLAESIGTYLNGCGYYETISVTFIDESIAELFTDDTGKHHLAVKDVSRKSSNLLRQSLIGSLLAVLKTNLNAGNTPCSIYELAGTFVTGGKKDKLPTEKTKLALACDGDLRQLRGTIEGLAKHLSRDAEVVLQPCDLVWAEAGAQVLVNGQAIGVAGVVSRQVKDKFDFRNVAPVAAELDFEQLAKIGTTAVKARPIPRFPAIERDLSVIVDEDVPWSSIAEAIGSRAPQELERTEFVGVYRGKGIAEGKKSVTLSLRFRDEDGTLTHETVDKFEQAILGGLSKTVGAKLRLV